jgi:NADPH-dependent 2,4-dienoyl-CoA reductase/sulfur reductase-like enzyme
VATTGPRDVARVVVPGGGLSGIATALAAAMHGLAVTGS